MHHIRRLHLGAQRRSDLVLRSLCRSQQGASSKPPNILVHCYDQNRFEKWKEKLLSVVESDVYTIYYLSSEHFKTQPWQETCTLLIYESEHGLGDAMFKQKIQDFILIFGKVLIQCLNRNVTQNAESNDMNAALPTTGIDSEGSKSCYVASNDLLSEKTDMLSNILKEWGFRLSAEQDDEPQLTPGFLICRNSESPSNIFKFQNPDFIPQLLPSGECSLTFHDLDSITIPLSAVASDSSLPVYYSKDIRRAAEHCPFDHTSFYKHLTTKHYGHCLVYVDIINSTQDLLNKLTIGTLKQDGVCVVARQQMKGRGRGGNRWLSPAGCMMFSCQLSIPMSSELGKKIPFIQHVVATSMVSGIKCKPGYEKLGLNLKWPNDIYVDKNVKIGGLIVNSSCFNGNFLVTFGLGVNVSNSNPTSCVNSVIREYNFKHGTNLAELTIEEVLSRTLNQLEYFIDTFQVKGSSWFCEEYYRHWLHRSSLILRLVCDTFMCSWCKGEFKEDWEPDHCGATVLIEAEGNAEGLILGLDDHGYLQVKMRSSGEKISLQPDGNSFDMMRNMIVMKKR